MSFRELYDFAQGFEPHIKRLKIREKVKQLRGFNDLKIAATGIDIRYGRGYFIESVDECHPLRAMFGCPLVLIARGMNRCWSRFVEVKELMHVFDSAGQATDTGDQFDQLLSEFSGPTPGARSPQMEAEIEAFYKALAVLCPEASRLKYDADLRAGIEDHYSIALKLRIPEQYVGYLFKPFYRPLIDRFLAEQ